MIALLMASTLGFAAPHVSADDSLGRDVHLRLDTTVDWGIGSQMYLGGTARLHTQLPVWHGQGATGSFDGTVRVAYSHEPTFLAPWIDTSQVQGAGNRVQVQLGVGHTAHLGQQRRTSLGVHLLAGWNHLNQTRSVSYVDEDFFGKASASWNSVVVTGELTLSYRVSERVGLNLAVGAPVPTHSSYQNTLVHAGLGVSWFLR